MSVSNELTHRLPYTEGRVWFLLNQKENFKYTVNEAKKKHPDDSRHFYFKSLFLLKEDKIKDSSESLDHFLSLSPEDFNGLKLSLIL